MATQDPGPSTKFVTLPFLIYTESSMAGQGLLCDRIQSFNIQGYTSSVVWSQVRWFFVLEIYVLLTMMKEQSHFRLSSMFYYLYYHSPMLYKGIYQICTIVQCLH